MKSIGSHPKIESETGALFLSVSFTLIGILLCLVILTQIFQVIILSNNLTNGFYTVAANTVTSLRRDFYAPLSETNTESIYEYMQSPAGTAYITSANRTMVVNLANNLNCPYGGSTDLKKIGPANAVIYSITDILLTYDEDICTISATVNIPIRFNGNHITDFEKKLEVSYALSHK